MTESLILTFYEIGDGKVYLQVIFSLNPCHSFVMVILLSGGITEY